MPRSSERSGTTQSISSLVPLSEQQRPHKPEHCTADDNEHSIYFQKSCQHQCCRHDGIGNCVLFRCHEHGIDRFEYQGENACTDTHKGILHCSRLLKGFQEKRNKRDNKKRWEYHTQRCTDSAERSCGSAAHKGCRVDRHWSGRGLCNCHDFQYIVLIQPLFIIADLTLYKRYHGVTAAEGKRSDFHKGQEQVKVFVHSITLIIIPQ